LPPLRVTALAIRMACVVLLSCVLVTRYELVLHGCCSRVYIFIIVMCVSSPDINVDQ